MQQAVVKKKSKGGKIIGALFGLALFVSSFFVLWLNEGRINYGKVAQNSLAVSAAALNANLEGQLVAANGDLTTTETLGDPIFLQPNDYVQLNRTVEMYAWDEQEKTDSDDNYYYEYTTVWTQYPEDSSQFYDSGYHNPPMPHQSQTFTVSTAQLGVYQVDPRALTYPEAIPLDLTLERLQVELSNNKDITNTGEYLYIGFNTITEPDVGDLRISFSAIPQIQNVTLFGVVAGNAILPYRVQEGKSLYRLFFINRESAIQQMEQEYKTALWLTRLGGFAMMWFGMFLVLNPITMLISFFPLLRQAGSWALILLTLPVAGVISFVVVVVSFLAHNPVALILLIIAALVIVGLVGVVIYRVDRKNTQNQV